MSEQWQIRRGTTAENNSFTGAEGEITMDTEKKQLRVHDGQTQGGKTIPDIGMILNAISPDYTAGVDISSSVTGTGYTAPKDGVIYYFTMPATSAIDVTVNGSYITRKGSTSGNYSVSGSAIVKKNDVFVMSMMSGGSVYFYPFKGAQ